MKILQKTNPINLIGLNLCHRITSGRDFFHTLKCAKNLSFDTFLYILFLFEICSINENFSSLTFCMSTFFTIKSRLVEIFHTHKFAKKSLFLTNFLHTGVLTLLSILGGKVCQKYRKWSTGTLSDI